MYSQRRNTGLKCNALPWKRGCIGEIRVRLLDLDYIPLEWPKLGFFSSNFPPLSNISRRPIARNLLQTGFQPVTQKRVTLEKIIPSDISRLLPSFDEERLLPAFSFTFRPYVKRKRRERFHHRFRRGFFVVNDRPSFAWIFIVGQSQSASIERISVMDRFFETDSIIYLCSIFFLISLRE